VDCCLEHARQIASCPSPPQNGVLIGSQKPDGRGRRMDVVYERVAALDVSKRDANVGDW
jgi:hypothetical protein